MRQFFMEETFKVIYPLLTVLNTVLIVTGLLYTIRHYRFNRTWSYIERYNSSDFLLTKKYVKMFTNQLNSFENDNQRKEYVKRLIDSTKDNDIEMILHLTRYVNLFTELGVAYKSGAWSKKAIISIAAVVISSWDKMETFIRVEQERALPRKIYNSFEDLYKIVKRKGLHEK
ncbi:MAG: hypothetical protein ABJG47_18570 [Ekhidna sp.]